MVHVPSTVSDEEFMPWLLKPDLHDSSLFMSHFQALSITHSTVNLSEEH